MTFNQLLHTRSILRAVEEEGYIEPTPIQAEAIPAILSGCDLMAAAQTGTGKTAAFTLPMLQKLLAQKDKSGHSIRALILVPTRELAVQIFESVKTYGRYTGIRAVGIYGGVNIKPQTEALRRGVDVAVATPGRLLDHMNRGHLDLGRVQTLVLDEADRMLDMGFIHDIKKVVAALPRQRQTLLFSATFSKEIKRLGGAILRKPKRIGVTQENGTVERIKQTIHPVDKAKKADLLSFLIGDRDWKRVLVFTRTKLGADKLSRRLGDDGFLSASIHGNKSQVARMKALKAFKEGRVRVLVATDVAARGIDITHLEQVVNFDLPEAPEDYVHRIGRTGRAGNVGEACSLVSVDERHLLRRIEKLTGVPIKKVAIEGYRPDLSFEPSPKKSRGNRPPRYGAAKGR